MDPAFIRDPDTDRNVLHYALDVGALDIAGHLIQEGNTDLIISKHCVQHSGLEGNRNILHILIEKGNKEMIEKVLTKIVDIDKEQMLVAMETVVEPEGQRPKLLPCLHLAAFYGNTTLLELFLDRIEMDINQGNSKGETALMWASRQGHIETAQTLIKRGADVNVENVKGSTALYWAVRYGHVQVATFLIKTGNADPQTRRKFGLVSPLILSCALGNSEMVDLLLDQRSVDVNYRIRGGETAIHFATREGFTDIVSKLLERGADVDNADEFGDTPLLLAVKYGHVDLANTFINQGASVDQRNLEGHDIWQYAIDRDDDELLEALVVTTQEMLDLGRQPLCVAASLGKLDKIDFLMRMGLETETTDKEGNSFLHYAAMENQHEVIKKFYSAALLDLQDKNGNTAFHIACYRGHENTIKVLIELKAKPGVRNNKGETVLHSAAYSKTINAESVNKLVEYTVKSFSWDLLNLKDYQGNNCLHIAAKHATPDVIWEYRNVSIKDQDKDGMTPLHEAVRPEEPEALDTMLDIFELARRDARINEQTFVSRETVLHFAANERHVDCVKRLMQLGADISERDCDGNTVMHRLIYACINDAENKLQYLEVFDIITDNVVIWWCIKNNLSIPYESDVEKANCLKEEAMTMTTRALPNNEGMSVYDLAFALGCSEILSRLLMMPDVTYFIREDNEARTHIFDISDLIPRTEMSPESYNVKKLHNTKGAELTFLPSEKKSKLKNLSGMEWLMTCNDGVKRAEILDIPPVEIVENHFTSLVAWTFTVLLFLHIAYMGVFTFVGLEVQRRLHMENNTMIFENFSQSETAILYFIVPLEPFIVFLTVLYTFLRYCFTGDVKRRIQLGRTQNMSTFISVLQAYILPLIYFSFSVLVFSWIILLRLEYEYQDYVLAVAVCLGWLLAINFTRGIKVVHYFYKMLLSIIFRDVIRFLIVYMFVLLAISLAIHVLFQISNTVTDVYQTTGDTTFVIFNVMTGMGDLFTDEVEDGMQAVGRTSDFIKAFYVLYIVLGTVIMLNLLIAMMNDSYSKVLLEKKIDWRIDSIKIGMELERSLPIVRVLSPVSTEYGILGKPSYFISLKIKRAGGFLILQPL